MKSINKNERQGYVPQQINRAKFKNTKEKYTRLTKKIRTLQDYPGEPRDDPMAPEGGAGRGREADAYLGGEVRQAGLTRLWTDPTFCVNHEVGSRMSWSGTQDRSSGP